jgi:hypothetical protein
MTLPAPLRLGPGTHRQPDNWPDKNSWLRSLGIDNYTIRLYGLDRVMDPDAWLVMVREAIRLRSSLKSSHEEQAGILRKFNEEGDYYARSRDRAEQAPKR